MRHVGLCNNVSTQSFIRPVPLKSSCSISETSSRKRSVLEGQTRRATGLPSRTAFPLVSEILPSPEEKSITPQQRRPPWLASLRGRRRLTRAHGQEIWPKCGVCAGFALPKPSKDWTSPPVGCLARAKIALPPLARKSFQPFNSQKLLTQICRNLDRHSNSSATKWTGPGHLQQGKVAANDS